MAVFVWGDKINFITHKFSISDFIGKAPLVKIEKINHTKANIFAKLEFLNPSGSIKDVMAFYMVEKAEKQGVLKPGKKIIEVTTGNTGISFALISAIRGYEFIAIMPENMSIERRHIMESLGAKVILTPKKENMEGAIKKYKEIIKENPDAWLPRQFENIDNVEAHEKITGSSILEQFKMKIHAFVAGVGTGGTLMGVAKALRKENPSMIVVAVEPAESAVMSGRKPGIHGIQGIGEGFIPKLIDMNFIDKVIKVKTHEAIEMTRNLIRKEGLLAGISSGANVLASLKVAGELGGGNIVTILPDNAQRYMSMNIFNNKEKRC